LAYLLRQEALGILGAVAICMLWPGGKLPPHRRAVGVVILAVCFVAVVAPYAIAVGKVMPNKSLDDLMHWSHIPPIFGQQSAMLARVVPWWLAPADMAEAWAKSGRYTISTLVLVALFLKSAPRAETTGRRLVMVAVVLQIILVQLRVARYDEISSRYMVIPLALSIPWAAVGLVTLLNLIIRLLPPTARAAKALVLIVGLAAPLAPQVYYHTIPINDDRRAFRDAGLWLRDHAQPTDRILGHDRLKQVMFYAGRTYPDETWIRLPEISRTDTDNPGTGILRQVRDYIRQHRPAWFVEAQATRRNRLAEAAYLEALSTGAIPELHRVWPADSQTSRASIYRVE
jgi:hypothetical protein